MSTRKPAIVLITADELRKDSLSCYGAEAIRTPNLDRLAERSVRFERAYANSPWCLPSRCALLTGRFPHNNGAYSNFRDVRLNPATPNLYTALKAVGYRTAHVGKCHYAPVPYGETAADRTLPYDAFREYYVQLGIDRLILQDDKQVSAWFYDDYSKELDAAGHLEAYRRCVWDRSNAKVFPFPGPAEWHPDAWVGRKAAAFIQDYADAEPLFAWVSFSGPHFPFDAPDTYFAKVDAERIGEGCRLPGEFDDPDRIHHRSFHGGGGIEGAGSAPERGCKHYPPEYWRDLRRHYYANVALIDEQVGHVLDALERRFGDDCLIIFTADHGEMLGNHGLWGKNNCGYEDVLNVPLLVHYPGATEGRATDALSMLIDVFPTCLAVAGVKDPLACDGTDFATHIARGGYDVVLSEGERFATVFDGRYKYICAERNGRTLRELFDLLEDPHEFHNLAGRSELLAEQARLQQALIGFFAGALLP